MIIIIMCRVYLSNAVFFGALERSYLRPLSAQLVTVLSALLFNGVYLSISVLFVRTNSKRRLQTVNLHQMWLHNDLLAILNNIIYYYDSPGIQFVLQIVHIGHYLVW